MSYSVKRRPFRWLEPQFQRKYTIYLLGIMLLVSSALIAIFVVFSNRILKIIADLGMLTTHPAYGAITAEINSMIYWVAIAALLMSLIVILLATLWSNQIVGPLFAVRRSLEALARGDFASARLKLRSGDDFQDVAELINKISERQK